MMGIREISNDYNAEIALAVLLLRIKMGKANDKDLDAFLASHRIEPTVFVKLLEAHQIESIVYATKGFNECFPEDEKIKNFKNRTAYRSRFNLVILEELISLQKLFNDFHYKVIFYKGVLLSKLLFDDVTTRTTADIDVLIQAHDFASMREILLAKGYMEDHVYPKEYPDYFLQINREALFRKKTPNGDNLIVELQWAPLPSMFSLPFNNDYFFKDTGFTQIMGEQIPVLSPEHHFVILLIHHGIGDLWRNLKHIMDIAMFAERYRDLLHWDQIERDIAHWRFSRNARVGMNLVEELLGIAIPLFTAGKNDIKETEASQNSLLDFPLLPRKKKNWQNIQRQFLLCDDFSAKIKLSKGYLQTEWKPSMIELENHYFPPNLFPLYYVTKRFRFLYKGNKKVTM